AALRDARLARVDMGADGRVPRRRRHREREGGRAMSAASGVLAPARPGKERSTMDDIERARDDVSASSAGGAPFLIAFGFTLAICGVLGLLMPVRTAAIVTLFQGNLALPLAFLLERRLGTRRLTADHPLRPLALQMAMS